MSLRKLRNFRIFKRMTQPYLGAQIIYGKNADTLPALLDSIKGHFDEFVLTSTQPDDGSYAIVDAFLAQEAARGAHCVKNHFDWIEDFGAARQFGYDAGTARWRMFLDADDILVGGETLRPFLVRAEVEQPQMMGAFVRYDYAATETLETMRLCKYDHRWRFCDAIHERLEFQEYTLPPQAFIHLGGISVKHRYKTEEEKKAAIYRNARIAEREYAKTTDPKYKARLARTIAMELKMQNKPAECIPYLKELHQYYASFPEGRQSCADLAKAYLALDDFDAALDWAKKAGPAYEGIVLHAAKRYPEALKAIQRSSGRGRQTTHEGYLFEDGAAYVAAADSCLASGLGADAAEACINRIPAVIRNEPLYAEALSAVRQHIDRITILVPGTPQPFDENGGGGMLGGSEEAVMYLTRELAALGRSVRVFGVLPPHRVPGRDRYGVDWQPFSAFNVDAEIGTLVIWRAWGVAVQLLEKKGGGAVMPGINTAWMWLHDQHTGLDPDSLGVLSKAISGCVTLSDFHSMGLVRQGWKGRIEKLSNGIVEVDFEGDIGQWKKDPNRVVYSSAAERGLVPLLEMWPAVKAACPEAYLDVYYDWSALELMQPDVYDRVVKAYEAVKHLDVKHHGGVDHATLNAAMKNASVVAYSHFENIEAETFCITAVKALACGATALTVPNGAIAETAGGDAYLVRSKDSYRESLIALLKRPEGNEIRAERARRALDRYGWKTVAKRFSDLWTVKQKKPVDAAADRA